jgi:dTDP-4-dehydrorhamnose 3,5-epimerase
MQIGLLDIPGVLVVTPVRHADERGFFWETYNTDILKGLGINANFVQDNHVYSFEKGVLRGLHFQIPPRAQGKLVRSVSGSILDVAVDMHRRRAALASAGWCWRVPIKRNASCPCGSGKRFKKCHGAIL